MQVLLKLTGSILYLLVMTIISPLLLMVYASLWFIQYTRHNKAWTKPLPNLSFRISFPQISFPFKRYAAAIWHKATAFHW